MNEKVNVENGNLDKIVTKATKEQERNRDLRILESSYDMYVLSRAEAIERRKNAVDKDGNRIYSDESLASTLELIDSMQEDIITKYAQLGGNVDELKARKPKKSDRKKIKELSEQYNSIDGIKEYRNQIMEEAKNRQKNKYSDESVKENSNEEPAVETVENRRAILENVKSKNLGRLMDFDELLGNAIPNEANSISNAPVKPEPKIPIVPDIQVESRAPQYQQEKKNMNYDEVSLPSRGECYKSKIDKVRVSHLVAYDENLILSPGLYRNGTFLDHILSNKILDNIDPDDLIQGDRDAIIIWLRAGGYGPMYPIRMTDDRTGEEFETEVDLSKLSFRKFTLKGDENGYFDFKLPVSGDIVKFKFLTAGDAKKLNKIRDEENEQTLSVDVRDKIRDIREFINNSEKITATEKERIIDDLVSLDEMIFERFKDAKDAEFTHDMTNRMIFSTISINGITDRKYIANYIVNMNLKDASAYRQYIVDNEPGIDYNIKVKRPDSLGGGYIDTFLRLDQFIFVY